MKIKLLLLTMLSSTISPLCSADAYLHVNGGVDFLEHNLSENNYSLVNLKAGLGYTYKSRVGFEIGVNESSGSTWVGEGQCFIGETERTCELTQSISRFMLIGTFVYNFHIVHQQIFVKIGVSKVKSSFTSSFKSLSGQRELVDEKNTDYPTYFSYGVVFNKHHRIGGVLSSTYGSPEIGKFKYVGLEYGFLITLW